MASNNMYVLRVRLTWAKGVWREIAVLGDITLDELHNTILDAYEWSEEDTYGFFMTNNIRDFHAHYSPDHENAQRDTKQVCLDDFRFDEGDSFLYVFAEGERNQFPIKIMILDDPDPRVTYPDVVDENGESPSQELAYE
jgi:hypothetical protein